MSGIALRFLTLPSDYEDVMEDSNRPSSKERKRRRSQRGQSLAEFALIFPVFLIIVFGIVDFSLGLKAWIAVTNSSREAARVLVLGQSCAQVTAAANSAASQLSPPVTVTITPSSCTGNSGDAMSVTVSYSYRYVTPLGNFVKQITGPITMSSTSTMRHE